jgi:hypothetical protein
MQELKEIQIEIKKELGGASLNHLMKYGALVHLEHLHIYFSAFPVLRPFSVFFKAGFKGKIRLILSRDNVRNSDEDIYKDDFILLNDQKQALNIFGQSEEFQRNLYDAIQIIKNINNK